MYIRSANRGRLGVGSDHHLSLPFLGSVVAYRTANNGLLLPQRTVTMTTTKFGKEHDEIVDAMSVDDLRTYAKLQRMDRIALDIAVEKLMEQNAALKEDNKRLTEACLKNGYKVTPWPTG
jgi:hypothetical protein